MACTPPDGIHKPSNELGLNAAFQKPVVFFIGAGEATAKVLCPTGQQDFRKTLTAPGIVEETPLPEIPDLDHAGTGQQSTPA
ncbi:hypothetical protein DC3_14220 [Deinococcus cellulosilyticus NBRC 106333 = KACC 11606]|uniref:Uncharacterized protein n=1 Tax=Deinococcus cellulosilyticus (strain DSM 18568 / NBRC 106333 / KACC 11606 / 5516J-15) TaxID=1223518 RepID=A0A511N023_DEIC1|nr:hypothetical protein DC3_14220 [Deinococcus cellulosilyticus NBRC 106333 = KACC 11606]